LRPQRKNKRRTGAPTSFIEGPNVSGVGVINASHNPSPGPGVRLCANVNNAARAAAADAPRLPQWIAEAKEALSEAENDPKITEAESAYAKAVAPQPESYRQKFCDVLLPIAATSPPPQATFNGPTDQTTVPGKSTKVRCNRCQHVQTVPVDQTTFRQGLALTVQAVVVRGANHKVIFYIVKDAGAA
jgi:hypothetical protein